MKSSPLKIFPLKRYSMMNLAQGDPLEGFSYEKEDTKDVPSETEFQLI